MEVTTILPFITILGRRVATYGLLNVTGAALGISCAVYVSRRRGLTRRDTFFASLYAIIGMLAGGKLLFLITALPRIFSRAGEGHIGIGLLSSLVYGGFVFYGGLIGGALGAWQYCRCFKLPAPRVFDSLAPGLSLAHAVGRVGCFFAGCCYGVEYHGAAAVKLNGVPRFPVQLFEAAALLLLSGFLILYSRKEPLAGKVTGFYLAAYSISRFFLEFLRGDSIRGGFLIFSTSQWLSLMLLPMGGYLIFRQNNCELLE